MMTPQARGTYEKRRGVLVDTYQATRDTTPANTATELRKKLGSWADEIVAAMILVHGDWDERISRESRDWARHNCPYMKTELLEARLFYCDAIHPAHMEQLARVLWEM